MKAIRPTLKRHELCLLIDGLESIIEEFEYDGGLNLAEDYIALHEQLQALLAKHDGAPSYLLAREAGAE